MHEVCRICLDINLYIDIFENTTKSKEKDSQKKKNLVELFKFCCGLEADNQISTKLCKKCFYKLRNFYKFKLLCLKNDKCLRSIKEESASNNEEEIYVDVDILSLDIKEEPDGRLQVDHDKSVGNNVELPFPFQGGADESLDYIEDNDNYVEDIVDIDDRADYIADIDKPIEDNVKHEEEIVYVVQIQESNFSDDDDDDTPQANLKVDKEPVKSEQGRKKKRKKDKGICHPHVCPECGKIVKNINTHIKTVHIPEESKLKYQCQECTKVFNSKILLNRHISRTHETPKAKCNICHKVVRELKKHILIMHNREKLKFQCVLCDAKFPVIAKLNIHIRTHTKDKPFECDVCQNKFTTKGQMMRHKSDVHEQRKRYACQICSKLFNRGHHLREHMRCHSNERSFWCDLCGKSLKHKKSLETHLMTVHSEEKRIPCTLCRKTFRHNSHLTAHMKSHRTDRRHLCRYCGRGFNRSDHRLNHERTHTNTTKRDNKTD